MKKILICLAIAGVGLLNTGCNDWLDVLPKNEQVAPDYWKTKEQVAEVLAQGYSYMRNTVPSLIYWGELRGGSVYAYSGSDQQKLQNFQLVASSKLCRWATFYQVLNIANSILKYAPEVHAQDETYTEAAMNSHMAEAYFMRAWVNFTLVRNYKEAPLILEPYVTDSYPFNVAKSSEEAIVAQIKEDIKKALDSGAAKEFYDDDTWAGATKGRVTKWALYALMADVCLWSEEYAGCVEYADLLINSTSAHRPAFMADSEQWFTIFNPGNSNESIFELNFDVRTYNQPVDNSPSAYFTYSTSAPLQYSVNMWERLWSENYVSNGASVRAYMGAYRDFCIWKYQGAGYQMTGTRDQQDANWILYRMADILLMKAEALAWQGGAANFQAAIDLINKVRSRANIAELNVNPNDLTEISVLHYVLQERDIELAAEGKRWYDLLRLGKSKDYKYQSEFIELIVANNASTSSKWLRSVLKNTWSWYLPVPQDDIERNSLLVQNPYYDITSN